MDCLYQEGLIVLHLLPAWPRPCVVDRSLPQQQISLWWDPPDRKLQAVTVAALATGEGVLPLGVRVGQGTMIKPVVVADDRVFRRRRNQAPAFSLKPSVPQAPDHSRRMTIIFPSS